MPTLTQPTLIRLTGQTSVTATPAPVTKLGDTSSSGTTFTSRSVVDGAAWDLSAVSAGNIAVTSGGYKGIIADVNDGTDTVTVRGWMPPGGGGQDSRATGLKPADGETVTIHQISSAKRLKILALPGNTQAVYIGLDATARTTDKVLIAGAAVVLKDDDLMDVTRIFARSASGTQTINFIVGGTN